MKFFELITSCSKPGLFEQICMALTRSYPWLAKDLQSDLKTERGNLIIDPDVVKEAAMLVHRLNRAYFLYLIINFHFYLFSILPKF